MSYRWYTERQDPLISVHGAFSAIADLALSHGVLEQQLFRSVRVNFNELIKPESKCSAEQIFQLIQNVESLNIKLPELPFRSALLALDQLQLPIKELLSTCSDIEERIDFICMFQNQINPLVRVEKHVDKSFVYLLIQDRYGFGKQASFVTDFSTTLLTVLLKIGSVNQLNFSVFLKEQEPRNIANHYQYLSDHTQFSSALNLLAIPIASHEKTELKSSIAKQRYILECQKAQSINKSGVSFIDECTSFIDQNLSSPELNLDNCASHFHKSSSTIKRKFKLHQSSFQDILNSRIILFALEKLYQGHGPSEVAEMLNYSDVANFRRMFKRCTGVWPKKKKPYLFYIVS